MDEENGKTGVMDNREYSLGGIIDGVNMKITKNNENMAFVTLLDTLGTLEVIVFPKTFEKYRRLIFAGSKVLIKGRAQVSEDEGKLIASDIISLDEALLSEKQKHTEVWILFEDSNDYKKNEQNLSQLLMDYRGFAPVFVQLRQEKKGMKLVYKVDPESGVIDALKLEYGIDRVITRETKR
jgi:DNA polymerase-3 subunit alpha